MILPSTYLGPISWYQKLLSAGEARIDVHEHYIKQTNRNRCTILGPNGKMDLIIPVKAPNHTPMKDVSIDNNDDWRRKHWGAIRSAYGQSPFFIHYADRFEKFYTKEITGSLIEFNAELLKMVLELIKEKKKIVFTSEFIPYSENDERLKPRDPHSGFQNYQQVFNDRFPFEPDLSIIDLIFCCGPEAKSYLKA